MVQQQQRHVVLLGRSGRPTSVVWGALSALRGHTALITMARCDASLAQEAACEGVISRQHRLEHVLHASGVLSDAMLPRQGVDSLRYAFAPKLGAVPHLDSLLACAPAAQVVAFSSIAALLGNAGQANYVAANTALDGWAASRQAAGLPGCSVQWGAWGGGGMAAETGIEARMQRMGIGVLSPAQGLAGLAAVLALPLRAVPRAVVCVNPFDWETVTKVVRPLPPQFRNFGTAAQGAQLAAAVHMPAQLLPAPAGVRKSETLAAIQKQVATAVATVLGHDIDPDEPLMDAGLDSLGMAEAGSAIQSAVGLQLPGTIAFDHPTISALAQYIDGALHPPPPAADDSAHRAAAVQVKIMEAINSVLGHDIDADEPLMDAGLDSLGMAEVGSLIQTNLGVELPSTVAFDYPTVSAMSHFVSQQLFPQSGASGSRPLFGSAGSVVVPSGNHQAVSGGDRRTAVVGMGLRLPRTLFDMQALAEMLFMGGDAITKVPADRWDIDLNTASGLVQRRRDPQTESYSRHGTFVQGIDLFDNSYFSVSPADAADMDPQQRVLLQACAEALHLGGLDRKGMRNSNTAAIIGICNNDFDAILRGDAIAMMLSGRSVKEVADKVGRIAYSTYAFAANRVSHTLGLVGPSLSVDTASASALVATHLATKEARNLGAGVRALSGGVNLILHPALTDLHTARNMFPKDGRCKTFDASADGFERGEGAAAVCQRALAEAAADGDIILAVVRGSTSIHKGGGASLRAMRGPAIQHKVRVALADAGMVPDDLRYIEASGLGEPYGDAVEVGAYQAVFQPGRQRSNPLVFGSIHTNIAHLDGASGIASFSKLVVLAQQMFVPPLVHFRQLHPLVTGRKKGKDEAVRMGHTYNEEVNVSGFPALFPMQASPLAGVSRREATPAGVSAFGFGGSMAHIIIDAQPLATTDRVKPPLRYTKVVSFPWKEQQEDSPAGKLQEVGEHALGYLESIIRGAVEAWVTPGLPLPRASDLFQAGLQPAAMPSLAAALTDLLGVEVTSELVEKHPSVSRLAAAVLERGALARAKSGFTVAGMTKAYMKLQTSRQVLDPGRAAQMLCRDGMPRRNKERMVIVLGSPRSGSTLLQLMLNMHPQLYAGQELYLLQFFSMEERAQRMASPELRSWAFEGLRKAVMELGPARHEYCTVEHADKLIAQMGDFPTQEVYGVLQAWAAKHGTTLVDKTPPYCWSLDTLRRAESMWEDVQYIWIHRHPYANVHSMATEAVRRDYIQQSLGDMVPDGALDQLDDALWAECDELWATGNANVQTFFNELPPERRTRVPYEDLLRSPDATARSLCSFLRLPYEPAMCCPYTASNLATFEPASADGLAAGDPKLRLNSGINPKMADAWLNVDSHRGISPLTRSLAVSMGYTLPAWKEAGLRPNAPEVLVRLNAATGGVPLIVAHGMGGSPERARWLAMQLPFPVFGVKMTERQFADDDLSFDGLAGDYLQALATLGLPPHVRLAALDDTGARLAHTMRGELRAARLSRGGAATPQVDALILLDGSLSRPSKVMDDTLSAHQVLWQLQVEASLKHDYPCPEQHDFLARMDSCASKHLALDVFSDTWKPEETDQLDWDRDTHMVASSVKALFPRTVAYGEVDGSSIANVAVISMTSAVDAPGGMTHPAGALLTRQAASHVAERLMQRLGQLQADKDAKAPQVQAPAGPSTSPRDDRSVDAVTPRDEDTPRSGRLFGRFLRR